jgi:hypothetical protein
VRNAEQRKTFQLGTNGKKWQGNNRCTHRAKRLSFTIHQFANVLVCSFHFAIRNSVTL